MNVEEDLSGEVVVSALVGPDMSVFEIRYERDTKVTSFYVNRISVSADVYDLALQTARSDQFCPDCMGQDEDVSQPS